MGIGITKPGVGPNGETVVGDNERALQLFFFKHGIAEAGARAGRRRSRRSSGATARRASRPTTPTSRSRTASRCGSPRSCPTTTRSSPGTAGAGRSPRRRSASAAPSSSSKAGSQAVADLRARSSTGRRSPAPTSARSSRTRPSTSTSPRARALFRVHVGQFKPPFGAQEMTSSGNQMFVDRALVSNSFFRGRETGVALWGATPNNKFEWRVGVFNGNGLTRTTNDNDKFQYNARADVAAERQPGAEPARLGDRRALLGERLRVDDDADLRGGGQLGEPEQLQRARPATTRSGTPSASTASTSSRVSRPTGCTRSRERDAGDRREVRRGRRLHPGRQAVQPPALRSRGPLRRSSIRPT